MNALNLQIKYRKTADLIPYAKNARTHSESQVAQIAASIKEFGFNNPVAIDSDNMILCGHGRVLAAQKLNLEEVPTVCLSHLSETQKKAYILADNKMALNADWDHDLLKLELEELKLDNFDLSLTGFEDSELDFLKEDDTELDVLDDFSTKHNVTIECEDLEQAKALCEKLGIEPDLTRQVIRIRFQNITL